MSCLGTTHVVFRFKSGKDGSMQQTQIKFDRDIALVVERGRKAWRDLRRDESWEKWVAIGRVIEAGRVAIMAHLGTNYPKGRTWSEVFGAWLKENEFDQIDKGARSRLQTGIENLPAVRGVARHFGPGSAARTEPRECGFTATGSGCTCWNASPDSTSQLGFRVRG